MAEVSVQVLENALPSSLKLTGSEKLGQVILEKGIQISDQIQPQLTNIQNELNSAPNGTCLPPAQLDLIILQRNNIVNKLNQIGSVLDTTTAAAGITSDLLNSLITAAQTLRVAKTALIAAFPACTRVVQKLIIKYEQIPTPSQPTNSWTKLPDVTKRNIKKVNKDKKLINRIKWGSDFI